MNVHNIDVYITCTFINSIHAYIFVSVCLIMCVRVSVGFGHWAAGAFTRIRVCTGLTCVPMYTDERVEHTSTATESFIILFHLQKASC